MVCLINRRQLLRIGLAAQAAALLPGAPAAASPLSFGPARPFSFDLLKARARELAAQPYREPPRPMPEVLQAIDYDAHAKIRSSVEKALQIGEAGNYRAQFFHLGMFFQKSVRIHLVDGASALEVLYRPDYFDMPVDSVARKLGSDAGFAGFRIHDGRPGRGYWKDNEFVVFLGAAYFRAIGELYQYGMSARGIAIDVAATNAAEEFPDFTSFWLESPPDQPDVALVHALLEGPSLAGAYRFAMRRTAGLVMDVEAELTVRRQVQRFGVAPLTSMFWFSETKKPTAVDWRPEVHDSDGLALWTGAGERIWRPLNNPGRVIASSFVDDNPKGFGLLQRDRVFDHFQDGVNYHRRPSVWVEPLDGWGRGSVQLVEIPTDDEIHDNIVAFWTPERPAAPASAFQFRYRLHWLADEPHPSGLARCLATRLGNGGQPGQPRPRGVRKFMVEFAGKPLEGFSEQFKPEPVLTATRGSFSLVNPEAMPGGAPGHWRVQFDLTVQGSDPVEMRCYLKSGDTVLSETWLYQYLPF